MSWSLELRNGDLAISGARLGQATGAQKLVQDLRCTILERMGTDDAHPTFGSLIDGGRDSRGNEIPSVLGGSNWDRIALEIESEIRRIVNDHQQRQLQRAQADRYRYGESTLTPDELLVGITDIDMTQAQDTLFVKVTLQTGTGRTFDIDIPLGSAPVITS